MERTTVYLDPELKRRLKSAAAQAHVSEARVIREALALYLTREAHVQLRPLGRSTDGGVADRDEETLEDIGFGRQ